MTIERIDGVSAICSARGTHRPVSLLLVADEPLAAGDQILVHMEFALRRLDPEEAALMWEAFDEALGGPAAAAARLASRRSGDPGHFEPEPAGSGTPKLHAHKETEPC